WCIRVVRLHASLRRRLTLRVGKQGRFRAGLRRIGIKLTWRAAPNGTSGPLCSRGACRLPLRPPRHLSLYTTFTSGGQEQFSRRPSLACELHWVPACS